MNQNTGRWIGALCIVFGLVVSTNIMDRRNFSEVSNSLETIYEDRLVAKDLIFDISLLIHEKSMALAHADSLFYAQRLQQVNDNIDQLIEIFSETKLTKEEELAFARLQADIQTLGHFEADVAGDKVAKSQYFTGDSASRQMETILDDLQVLSKIQLEEGKRQMLIGKAAVYSIDFLTEMEIYILIVMGIVAQVLLIRGFNYKRKRQIANTGNWMEN